MGETRTTIRQPTRSRRSAVGLRTVAGPLILLILAAMCLLAGLWLRDGQRRGAILAAVLDGSLLLFSPARFGLDTLVTLGLLVGAIAVLPMLSSTAEP